MLKNTVEPDRPQMTTWSMRIGCWISKATDTHPEYVILIAFPLQRCLRDLASMLCHTYIAFIAVNSVGNKEIYDVFLRAFQ